MNRSRDTASRSVRAASLAEIPYGKSEAVNLNGRMIALFKTGDRVFAVDNRCPPYESVSRSAPSDVEIQTSRWTFGLRPGGVSTQCGKLRASVDRGDEGRQLA